MNSIDIDLKRTIVAVASAGGSSVRGVLRLSGPDAIECVCRLSPGDTFAPRRATAYEVNLNVDGISVPVAARVLIWPDARSFTRQPMAEIHTLGNPLLLDAIARTLCRFGASRAAPGEFTLRAFLAGRIDLTQAEAIMGAVDAANAQEFEMALRQNSGGLSRPLDALRDELVDLLAHLEAGLDFVEDDIEFISDRELRASLERIASALSRLRRQIGQRSIAGELPRVVLIGRPNVGKSSLFNALVGKPVAISFDAAGTTRDYLNETVCWEGQGIRLFDSAGIERGRALLDEVQRAPANASPDGHGDQSISRMAERTSRELVAEADLCIECVAAEDALDAVESSPLIESQRWLIAMTKSDLGGNACPRGALPTSAVTGSGIPELKAAIVSALRAGRGDVEVLPITAARCSEALEGTSAAISRALGALDDQHSEEFIAAELRVALENLGTVVGAIYNEDILDRVFSRFCIGK